ncbi:MAG: deoxyribose-phosphate aldolase [Bacilli bacterium]|jgi:deoxyribose-phosphate aldolase|nr:deoxyribose-phosphate aldolase [Bacilli bacterium]
MEINKYIDHTNLNRKAKKEEIEKLCDEAIKYNFASVCVHPYYVKLAKELLTDSDVAVCTVIGFPLGMNTTEVKVFETQNALENGADEIDMVINVAALKDKEYYYVENEIREIRNLTEGKILKVIIEECALTEDEIIKITQICNECNVDFVKTSTGFDEHGATMEAVHIIRENKKENIGIKASGGIRDYDTAMKFIDAGATRIGTSSGIKIMEGE